MGFALGSVGLKAGSNGVGLISVQGTETVKKAGKNKIMKMRPKPAYCILLSLCGRFHQFSQVKINKTGALSADVPLFLFFGDRAHGRTL